MIKTNEGINSKDAVRSVLVELRDSLGLDDHRLDLVSLAIMVYFAYNVGDARERLESCSNPVFQSVWVWSKGVLKDEPPLVQFIDDFGVRFEQELSQV